MGQKTVDKIPSPLDIIRAEEHASSRTWISRPLSGGYLVLLAIVTAVPLALYIVRGPRSVTANEITDLVVGLVAPLSGLVGLLGFVLGFYFKEYTK